ncbi:MAG: DUF1850 domain-containing protein [Micrococcus sp.]|nr:DUF1850 domain-containing protein [Micrococcus sp.]
MDLNRRWVLVSGVVLLTGCTTPGTLTLECAHQRTDEIFGTRTVAPGDTVRLSWIHSIELTDWTDTFRVEDRGFTLIETEFSSYGAGMPTGTEEGTVHLGEDSLRITDLDRPFESIRWIHSVRQRHRIDVAEARNVFDTDSLPDRQPLELRTR